MWFCQLKFHFFCLPSFFFNSALHQTFMEYLTRLGFGICVVKDDGEDSERSGMVARNSVMLFPSFFSCIFFCCCDEFHFITEGWISQMQFSNFILCCTRTYAARRGWIWFRCQDFETIILMGILGSCNNAIFRAKEVIW